MASSPLSGCSIPARIRRSVDFPEPLGPISPIRSASETVKEIFSKRGVAPNAFEILCALMMGGNGYGLLILFEVIKKPRCVPEACGVTDALHLADNVRFGDRSPRITSALSCPRSYNGSHQCLWPLARNSAPTKFSHSWVRVVWGKCI